MDTGYVAVGYEAVVRHGAVAGHRAGVGAGLVGGIAHAGYGRREADAEADANAYGYGAVSLAAVSAPHCKQIRGIDPN